MVTENVVTKAEVVVSSRRLSDCVFSDFLTEELSTHTLGNTTTHTLERQLFCFSFHVVRTGCPHTLMRAANQRVFGWHTLGNTTTHPGFDSPSFFFVSYFLLPAWLRNTHPRKYHNTHPSSRTGPVFLFGGEPWRLI